MNPDISIWKVLPLALLVLVTGCSKDASEDGDPEVALTAEEQKLDAILDNPDVFTPVEDEPLAPGVEEFVLNKSAQVSVLCYHDFSTGTSTNPMIMQADKFRTQMKAIQEAGIPVITMEHFNAWLAGEKNVPDPCIVITIDDGWKAVHSIAMPILKEYGFPFTVFLYQNYVDIGGRSLKLEEIEDIMENGGEIGCHSKTHTNMADRKNWSDEDYRNYLRRELGESQKFLEETLGVTPKTFAYPFGKYSDEAIEVAKEFGYTALFTVNGRRAKWDDPRGEIGRFVIHGDNDYNFKLGTSFTGRGNLADNMTLAADAEDLPFDVSPKPEERVRTRRPEIAVDLSRLDGVIEDSISLRVGGFGRVPVDFDETTRIVSYRVPQVLRTEQCLVQFSVRVNGQAKPYLLPWRFYIDPQPLYLSPETETESEKSEVAEAEDVVVAE